MLRMSKPSVIYLSILLLFLSVIVDKMYAQESPSYPPIKNIMVLHAEWQLWKWAKPFDSILYTEMSNQNDQDLRITFEFLGLESVQKGAYPQEVIEHLRYKIAKKPLDLVIALLPQANEFLLSYGQEVFPRVPKIFVLPSGTAIDKIHDLPDAAVIPSSSDVAIKTNVERIFSILPDTKELVVVCGNSLHDLTYLKRAKEAIATYDKDIRTNYLVGEPLDELLPKVSNLPKNAVILFLTYSKDTNNRNIVSAVAISQISESANVPIFGFYDSLLGRGIVGGNLTSSGQYAKKTAELGLRLLRGEPISSIPSVKDATIDIYDWRQLKRWNISEDRLPQERIIRYKTVTLWEAHKAKIIMALLFICFQTALIFVLIVSLRRQRKIENDLRESEKQLQNHRDHLEMLVEERTTDLTESNKELMSSEERFRSLSDASFEGIVIIEAGNIVDANKTIAKMFGYERAELIGMRSIDLVAPEMQGDVQKKILSGYEKSYDSFGAKKDGSIFPFEAHAKMFLYKGQQVRVTAVRDLTEKRKAEEEISILRGILPICSFCKKIRDDKGYWNQIESYIHDHSEAEFSHGVCQECAKKHYPDEDLYGDDDGN